MKGPIDVASSTTGAQPSRSPAMTPPAVLLVNPRVCDPSSVRLPLAVMNLAAMLEGHYPWRILDGNLESDQVGAALRAVGQQPLLAVGMSTMPGPQMVSAIEIASAIRRAHPSIPIVWGGYFPTIYPDAAINAPYVDYLVRGQGEGTLIDLLQILPSVGPPSATDSGADTTALSGILGLSWKREGHAVHNPERPGIMPDTLPLLPYERLPNIATYLRPSFLGQRTAVYQAALGCRYRCEFCGVVTMWNGRTLLEAPDRLLLSLGLLKERWGADSIQFYDNNFFDNEEAGRPTLEVLGKLQMPWWCFARTDTLSRFSSSTWELIRKAKLRMAFFGAEAASDEVLNRMKKGARVEHTLEVAVRCREYGVVPEFSFILGGPEDPEDQIEKTFEFIRRIKNLNPESEVVLQYYSPTPQRDRKAARKNPGVVHLPMLASYGSGGPSLPTTPEEWAEPTWLSWVCQKDAPWLTPRLRKRVRDVARVLACRFPTEQDYRTPPWAKAVLRNLARWRYATRRYDDPWELAIAQRIIRLRDPKTQSL
jgi:anaerobic magnesium-protoporphyrin IX monomethyl ester cyclase